MWSAAPAQALWHMWNGSKCHLSSSEDTGGAGDMKRHLCKKHNQGCEGSESGGSARSGGAPNLSPGDQIIYDAAKTLTEAAVQSLFAPKKEAPTASDDRIRQQQEAERQRREEQRRLEAEQAYHAEQERQRLELQQTEQARFELMRDMRAPNGEAMSPNLEAGHELSFKDYTAREEQKRQAPGTLTRKLTKPQEDWCKMNRPLSPTRPIQPIPESQYDQMVYQYQLRKLEWEDKCLGAAPGWDLYQ
jgi:hypothetical protein